MKILFAGASGDRYGADAVLRCIAAHMATRGADCLLVLPEDGPGRTLAEEQGLRVEIVPMPVLRRADLDPRGLARLGASVAKGVRSHLRTLRREQPDVVWVNTVTIPLWIAAARLLRREAFCHTHEVVDGRALVRRLMYAPLLLADGIVTVSDACRLDMSRTWRRLDGRVSVRLNPSFGVRNPLPVHPGSERDLVVIGRISRRKGHEVLLQALADPTLAAERPVLHVCGTAYKSRAAQEFLSVIRQRASALSATVHFHGYVPTEKALRLGGTVVVPSIEPEACPLVISEAMAAGRAVVASNCGGIAELTGGAALLVEPGRSDVLAAALARVLTDPDKRSALRAAGLLRANVLSPDRYLAAIDALLKSRPLGGRQALLYETAGAAVEIAPEGGVNSERLGR